MKETRMNFTHDQLLDVVRKSIDKGLSRHKIRDKINAGFSNKDCLMSGLAVFTFKYPSLLSFDKARLSDSLLKNNLTKLFKIDKVPCDTYMRTRLDTLDPNVLRKSFTSIFSLVQRSKVLDNYKFLDKYYLVSVDGTGVFSSNNIHCENCCEKVHNRGKDNEYTTYHHQLLAAALVHPDQKVVFPFAPEPILKQDGSVKNDCERNAMKRWVSDFRREHPHLPVVILGDGLYSNSPNIKELSKHNLRYLLVCKEGDHSYLFEWINAYSEKDAPIIKETVNKITHQYQYFNDVPLHGEKNAPRVTVVRYKETKVRKGKEITTTWAWITDLEVTDKNIREIAKGARARFHIENQTFNTLKNQGYEFEHNFGHGKKYLNHVFSMLMMLAFFIDQCLQKYNKRFQAALSKSGAKYVLWERMRNFIYIYAEMPDFETLYECIVRPPTIRVDSVM